MHTTYLFVLFDPRGNDTCELGATITDAESILSILEHVIHASSYVNPSECIIDGEWTIKRLLVIADSSGPSVVNVSGSGRVLN